MSLVNDWLMSDIQKYIKITNTAAVHGGVEITYTDWRGTTTPWVHLPSPPSDRMCRDRERGWGAPIAIPLPLFNVDNNRCDAPGDTAYP